MKKADFRLPYPRRIDRANEQIRPHQKEQTNAIQ